MESHQGYTIFDPDGNEVEVFYELHREKRFGGDIFRGNFPMRLDGESFLGVD